MASVRRIGAETSQTREQLLNCVERLMIDQGYAGVTYRAVAAKAEVTAGLVQYYFPTLDDIFLAAIRRRSQQNLERLTALLETDLDQPLRALWDYSREESTAALTTEFLALGNHRPSIKAEIAEVTEQVRRLQFDALTKRFGRKTVGANGMPVETLLFLLTGIPKLIRLEQGVGVSTAHGQVVRTFERLLSELEPSGSVTARKPASRPSRGRSTSGRAGRSSSRSSTQGSG